MSPFERMERIRQAWAKLHFWVFGDQDLRDVGFPAVDEQRIEQSADPEPAKATYERWAGHFDQPRD